MKFPRVRIGARTGVLLVLVVLLGIESGLSFAGFGQVAAAEADPVLGWRKIPGEGQGRRGEFVSINRHGFRDDEWKPPSWERVSVLAGGTAGLRVAVLGDSVSFGAGVEAKHVWTRRFEAALATSERSAESAGDVLVMNLALPGYTFEQMARAYEEVAREYRPDIVVFALNPYSVRPMRPPLEAKSYPLRRFVERTATWDFIVRRILIDHGMQGAEREHTGLAEQTAEVDVVEAGVRDDPYGAAAAPMWAEIHERLARLHAEITAAGSKVVLVALPRIEEVLNPKAPRAATRWGEIVAELDGALFVDPLAAFRKGMQPLLSEVRAADVKPRQVWRAKGRRIRADGFERKAETLFFYNDPAHYTPRGHALLAEVVYTALVGAHWID